MSKLDKAAQEYLDMLDTKARMGENISETFKTYDAFRHGAAWLASKLKHEPMDPEDNHCQCLTCIKLHRMGL